MNNPPRPTRRRALRAPAWPAQSVVEGRNRRGRLALSDVINPPAWPAPSHLGEASEGAAEAPSDTFRTLRTVALWGLIAAKILGGWGVQWDIRWHLLIGRDSFWIAP